MNLREVLAAVEGLPQASRMELENLAAELAQTVMELNAQKQLAGRDGMGPEVAKPKNEPPGQAPDGTAFQR